MQVLKGNPAPFLYETVRGELRPHIASTQVLVLEVPPTLADLETAKALDCGQCLRDALSEARLGRGYLNLTKTALARSQSAALSEKLAQAGLGLHTFERDDCLLAACTQVSFHHDLPLAGIFGAWCLSGPARDLVFPRLGLRIPFVPGTLVIFDAVQPHGLLACGQPEFAVEGGPETKLSVFVSLLLNGENPPTNELLNRCAYDPMRHAALPRLAQGQPADPRTGELTFLTI